MATRITRLRSRESSVRTVSERSLKPKKVVVTNKNLKKINVSKSLSSSKGNASLRNGRTAMRLRPRQNRKNYCEDSKLLQQQKQDSELCSNSGFPALPRSVVRLERLNLKGKKAPVYTIESSEKSSEDKTDVYDFKGEVYDFNDTRKKAVKKKKKRNVNKGQGKITKKTTRKKIIAKKIEASKINPDIQVKESVKKNIKQEIGPPRIDTDINTVKNIDINTVENMDTNTIEKPKENTIEIMEASRASTSVQALEERTFSDKTLTKQIGKEDASKPRIISIENADNITITKSNISENSWPFRPKNTVENKTLLKEYNSPLKCSFLTKTVSPILKTSNTLNIESPWRPPTLMVSKSFMFSQTKHFIQSTPYKNLQTHKEINNKSIKMNKENMEMDKENMEEDKENMDVNKENKNLRVKERKKSKTGLRKKRITSENQSPKKMPARVSLGEIKNLLQRSNVDRDDKQAAEETYTEGDKSLVEQKNKQLVDFLNFTDTFDILSETEKLSNIENDAPLFVDLEPSYFSKPPQHLYSKRKRAVKFDFSEDSNEEEKENIKLPRTKKKKVKKLEKELEQEKRINEWIQTVNTTFEEIDKHTLIIEKSENTK